jgi:hypothetical protein
MKVVSLYRILISSIVALGFVASAAVPSAHAATAGGVDAKTAFARMKSLAGTWSGPKMMGQRCNLNYRVIAGGSAVLETCFEGTPMEMVTVYYPVGNSLVQTHYCVAGNQPHMKLNLKKSSADTLVFDFAGGDNIKTTKMNMHATTLHFVGKNKMENTCTGQENGKLVAPHTAVFTRA